LKPVFHKAIYSVTFSIHHLKQSTRVPTAGSNQAYLSEN